MPAFNPNQLHPAKKNTTGGAMPDISQDAEDIYGYSVPNTGVVVWRADTDPQVWKNALLTHLFHRIQVDYFRYSVDGGKRLDEYLEMKERMNETPQPIQHADPVKRMASNKKDASTLRVSVDKLKKIHYGQLRHIAKSMDLDTRGDKPELVQRILDAQSNGAVVNLAPELEEKV